MSKIILRGLRAGNLRNLDLELPHGNWTAVHGPSGAGKSALLFRTIEPVARQRYRILEDPQALPGCEEQWLPHVAESMQGLQPVLAAAGEIPRRRRMVEVGTALDLWTGLERMFLRHGERRCSKCETQWTPLQKEHLLKPVLAAASATVVHLFAAADGMASTDLLQAGWTRVRLGGGEESTLARLEEAPEILPKPAWLLLDRLKWRPNLEQRFLEAAQEAVRRQCSVMLQVGKTVEYFSAANQCPNCHHFLPNRDDFDLRHQRDLEDWVLHGRSWAEWCRAPLQAWLELPDGIGFRSRRRLDYLARTRLGHLAATRTLGTLSLGEGRRLELVALLSQVRCGQLALFDEPGMGLHGSERRALAALLRELVEQGNTVLTADPAREFLEAADHWLLLGPGGGEEGGRIEGQGRRRDLPPEQTEIQARSANPARSKLGFRKLQHRFLDIPKLSMPLGQVVAVIGVSGSGKSTLLEDELVPRLREERDFTGKLPDGGVAVLLERALGSSAFSTLATLSGGWKAIRDAFAAGEEARIRGISASDLVARVDRGACTSCRGHGLTPDRLPCAECEGLGLRDDLLQLRLRNRSLRQWLTTPISRLEKRLPSDGRLRTLVQHLTVLGLGNRTFGERGAHLSLGERGRIALAKALASSRRDRPKLFLLDEPCLGLPFREAHRVVELLHQLCQQGHSFWVVEHHEVMLRSADHVIEIGPGAGPQGGHLLFEGPPEKLDRADTPTGHWLASRSQEVELPQPPTLPPEPKSEALAESWSRPGRLLLEQDLLRELSTRSPLLADLPGMQEDLIGAANALAPTAWPAAAPADATLWQVLGLETAIQQSLYRYGAMGCSACGGPGPWKDLGNALTSSDVDAAPPGLLEFAAPIQLPEGSKGSETALLQAAGFRKVLRDGELIRLSPKVPYQSGDEVWLDAFEATHEVRSGRIQDLQHHIQLLCSGRLLARVDGKVSWQYQHQSCRQCGTLDAGTSHQLGGQTLLALAQMPMKFALAHMAKHGNQPIFSAAINLLGGSSLLHHPGTHRARKCTESERRAARLCGWLLFPLPGVVLLHDQPLSGLPIPWARSLAKHLLNGEYGCHRFTDPENYAGHSPSYAVMKSAKWRKQLAKLAIEDLPMEFDCEDWALPSYVAEAILLRQALGLELPLQTHFARTEEARLRGMTASDLSKKRAGATCRHCRGVGGVAIHAHFAVRCGECRGSGWAKEYQAIEERGLRWGEVGQSTLAQLQEHFSGTPGIAQVLDLAVRSGMGEVKLDTPISRLPRGCRGWAPVLLSLAAGDSVAQMRLAGVAAGLNDLEVQQLLSTIVDFASTQLTPNWRDSHPALAPKK